jgi:hypothetical protein
MEGIHDRRIPVSLKKELLREPLPDPARIDEHPARAWQREHKPLAYSRSADKQVEPTPVQG